MVKLTLPKLTPAHRAFNQRAAEAQDRTTKYVIPVFATNDEETYTLGSAVLLKISNDHFLITAAHVTDEQRAAPRPTDLKIVGKNRLLAISGGIITSNLPASGNRAEDTIDISILPLTTEMVNELSYFNFLTIGQVDPSDKPYKQSLYTFTGYPAAKQAPPHAGKLTIEPVRFTSTPIPPDEYPKGYSLGPHMAIAYDKKKMISRDGKLQPPPSVKGMSGGGVFRLGTFHQIINGTNAETLVGIGIEAKPRCLIGTAISFPLEMIRANFPALDQYIPRTTNGTISVTTK